MGKVSLPIVWCVEICIRMAVVFFVVVGLLTIQVSTGVCTERGVNKIAGVIENLLTHYYAYK